MLELLVVLNYAATFTVVIWYVSRISFFQIRFEDGILIGLLFFIIAPVTLALFTGEIPTSMNTGPLKIREEPFTAIQICIGCFLVVFFHAFCRNYLSGQDTIPTYSQEKASTIYWMLVLYALLTVFMFFKTGKAAGGHWHQNSRDALNNSFSVILLGNFVNVYRAAIFGVLYNFANREVLTFKRTVLLSISISTFDLILTFNRIAVVYLIIMLFLMYRKYIIVLILFFAGSFSTIAYLSTAWTAMRGIALTNGFSLGGIINAFHTVNAAIKNDEIQIISQTGMVFESANIIVFDWIVKNAGTYKLPLDWGETFIVRPLTVFFPSFLWSGKPASFGLSLGSEIQNVKGLVLNSTLFGEAYGNFGFLWPIPLLIALILLAAIFKHLGQHWSAANGMAFFIAFALWRFDISFGVVSLVAIISAMVIIRNASKLRLGE